MDQKPSQPKAVTPALRHIPEAMAALEGELTATLQVVTDLEQALKPALNPVDVKEQSAVLKEDPKHAPLAERIWMNVQTVQQLRNQILALTMRTEL